MARPKLMRVKRREVHSSDEMDYVSPSISSSRPGKRPRHSILPPMDQILQSMSQSQAHLGPDQAAAAAAHNHHLTPKQPQTARPSALAKQRRRSPSPTEHLSSDSDESGSESDSSQASATTDHSALSLDSRDSDSDGHVSQSATSYEEEPAAPKSPLTTTLGDSRRNNLNKECSPVCKPSPPVEPPSDHEADPDYEPEVLLIEEPIKPSPKTRTPVRRNNPSPKLRCEPPSPEVDTNQPPPSKKRNTATTTTTSNKPDCQLLTDALLNLHTYMDKLMDSHKDFIQAVKLGFENMRLVLDKV